MESTTNALKPVITTIKLSKRTKARLDKLKAYKRETYEGTISKLLGILNLCKINPLRAKHELQLIDKLRESNKKSRQQF